MNPSHEHSILFVEKIRVPGLVCLLSLISSGLFSCGHTSAARGPQNPSNSREVSGRGGRRFVQRGKASWYGRRFHGKKTASGERYNMNAMTAAHRKLPFHTIVRVTRTADNKSVVVRINDRGPYIKGRIIDLSRKAASRLNMLRAGVVDVRVEVIKWGTGRRRKKRASDRNRRRKKSSFSSGRKGESTVGPFGRRAPPLVR